MNITWHRTSGEGEPGRYQARDRNAVAVASIVRVESVPAGVWGAWRYRILDSNYAGARTDRLGSAKAEIARLLALRPEPEFEAAAD